MTNANSLATIGNLRKNVKGVSSKYYIPPKCDCKAKLCAKYHMINSTKKNNVHWLLVKSCGENKVALACIKIAKYSSIISKLKPSIIDANITDTDSTWRRDESQMSKICRLKGDESIPAAAGGCCSCVDL